MSEYGWVVEYTMARPLGQAFALYAAISSRYGNDATGPTYADKALLRALREVAATARSDS